MKMTRFEKRFVNRKKISASNIKKLELAFEYINIDTINTVLEIGCGVGFVSAYLADSYKFDIYGTDCDAEQIRIAEKIQPKRDNLHYQVQDAKKLSFEDSSIGLVLSQNVFHHIPDWEGTIHEIKRVLYPNGYFIWFDLAYPEIVKKIFLPFVKNYGLYTVNDIKTAFKDFDFKTLFQERLSHGPLSQYHYVLQLD